MSRFTRLLPSFVLIRRLIRIGKPYWFPNGWKSSYGLLLVAAFVGLCYYGLNIVTQQANIDAITHAIVGAMREDLLTVLMQYALPGAMALVGGWYVIRRFWPKNEWVNALLLLTVVLLMMLSVNSINVVLNFANGAINNALNHRDAAMFWVMVYRLLAMFVIGTFFVVFYGYVRNKLVLSWRRWLTNYLLEKYFADRNYYRINRNATIDNPDERMANDVDAFVSASLSLTLSVLGAIITFFTFVNILKMPEVDPTGTLSTIAYIWAGGFTLVSLGFGKKLAGLVFNQRRREADFRYNLIHIRNHTESIAAYRGEAREKERVKGRFNDVLKNWDQLIGWTRNLGFIQTGSDYFTVAIPFIVLGPLYFAGTVEMGTISQAAMAFGQVLSALTIVVTEFRTLSEFSAYINRIAGFCEALEAPSSKPGESTVGSGIGPTVKLDNVTVYTPDRKHLLVKEMNYELLPKRAAVLMGPSGSGKSSLVRIIAGLWDSGSGIITHPDAGRMMFLPQEPYMPFGTLRQQLFYPGDGKGVSEEKLNEVLKLVKLEDLPARVGGFETEMNWAEVLSVGQRQRVAFARLFLAEPEVAFLDEATSALDMATEQEIYQLLRESNMAYFSIGHRPSLIQYHDDKIELTGVEGGWNIAPVTPQ